MPPPGVQRADDMVRASLSGAARVISLRNARGRRSARELLRMLEEADRVLSERLRAESIRFGGPSARFTGASAMAYRAQIRTAADFVRARLSGLTARQSEAAIRQGLRQTASLLEGLEEAFTGITVPLRLRQAAVMDNLTRGIQSTLLRQHATSVDRYGQAMIGEFEGMMRAGMISGASQDQMVAALTGHGGPRGRVSMRATVSPDGTVLRLVEQDIPEGLFVRHRYWAERVVRTETAHAYNEGHLQGFYEARRDAPDMQKKILATFDDRTAPDSVAVHGQIRPLEGYFRDGAGREYLRPPARPNDRETVIPWRPHWSETPITRERTAAEQAQAIAASTRGAAAERRRTAARAALGRVAVAKERAAERRRAAQERRRARKRLRDQMREDPAQLAEAQEAARRAAAEAPPRGADYGEDVQFHDTPDPTLRELRANGRMVGRVRRTEGGRFWASINPPGTGLAGVEIGSFGTYEEAARALRRRYHRDLRRGEAFSPSKLAEALERRRNPAARRQIRALLRQEGIQPRDDLLLQPRRDQFRKERSVRYAGMHDWQGRVYIKDRVRRRGARVLREMAEGRAIHPTDTGGLRTLIHEEVHGATPHVSRAYRGPGVGIEEATTEITARRLVRNVTRQPLPRVGGPSSVASSYQEQIDYLVGSVRDGMGVTLPQAAEIAEEASLRMRRPGAVQELVQTPEGMVDLFLDNVEGLTAAQRATMRERLLRIPEPPR